MTIQISQLRNDLNTISIRCDICNNIIINIMSGSNNIKSKIEHFKLTYMICANCQTKYNDALSTFLHNIQIVNIRMQQEKEEN